MRRLLLVVLLASLAPAGAAAAKIVPGRSIAGVKLDMTRAEVKALKGDPLTRRRVEDLTIWTFPGKLRVVFLDRAEGVTSITTESRRQRTASGLGVGSTVKAVRRKLSGEHCNDLACSLGTLAHRSRNSFFYLDGGIVQSVEVRRQFQDGMP
jgi:hypothetical protein